MALIALPSFAKFPRIQWTPKFRNQVNRSAWSGKRKVMGMPGGELFGVSCEPRVAFTETEERAWRSFVTKLRGQENTFQLQAACSQFVAGAANPTVLSGGAAGASTATLSGIPTGGLKEGMFLTFNLTGGLKQLVVVSADTLAGSQLVTFQPALRKAATGTVEAKNPYAEVALLKDDSGWSRSEGGFTVGFEAEEAF